LKLGKPRLFSKNPEQTRKKMSAAKKGNTYSLGYKHSDETRAKMRAGWVLRKQRKVVPHLTPDEAFKKIVDAAQSV